MSSIDQLIANARALLQSSQAEKALELLTPNFKSNENNIEFLQIFGETLLENNDLENGYEILVKACDLDLSASKGTEKFFYLGQIIGGFDGLKYLDVGLNRLNEHLSLVKEDKGTDDEILVELSKLYTSKKKLVDYLVKKLNQGIFAKIEIWMTDLCMEDEAESKCNELIEFSLNLDSKNPEALSLLSSIRISQQRNDEAREALMKSWNLFQEKKTELEESANKLQNSEEDEDSFEVGLEYIELIQPLLTLTRFAIESELYDLAITISSNTQDINENILEPYYYEGLANLFNAKKIYVSTENSSDVDDYRDIDIDVLKNSSNSEIKNLINEAKLSLTQGYKIINSDAIDADPDLIDQVSNLLSSLGGPIMSELLPQRKVDGEDEDWENEINSDDDN